MPRRLADNETAEAASVKRAFAIALLAVAVAAPASATEMTIVPGVGIGKVRLGMTLAQVKKVLGQPQTVNARKQLSGHRGYIEYGWNFSSFWVGFVNTKGVLHAALVGTVLRGEKTASGVGVGTSVDKLRGEYKVACTNTSDGPFDPHQYRDPGEYLWSYCVIGSPAAPTTVFGTGCAKRETYSHKCTDWRIYRVIVREGVLHYE
jgi:opacity protein-like surface antigen